MSSVWAQQIWQIDDYLISILNIFASKLNILKFHKNDKNIKSVGIFYDIKSISEPGATAVQLKTAWPGL